MGFCWRRGSADDGHSLYRYVNQTDYEAVLPAFAPAAAARDRFGGRSTATTPLGHLLAFGTHHAAGDTGPTPSGTSRYYSPWRDCHFADALYPSLLKHLLKVEGGAA